MKKTIEKLLGAPDLDTYEGTISTDQVYAISSQTGCELPSDYVEFLSSCGFAFWTGHAVNGVYDDNDNRFPKSYNFSAITQTLRARKLHSQHKYPYFDNSIVLGKDDTGGYFLLVSAVEPGATSVAWVNMDANWVVTRSWNSFESFLESQL